MIRLYDFEKIERLISESGISSKVFLSSIGLSEKTLLNWKNGTTIPRKEHIEKIAKKLDVESSVFSERLVDQEKFVADFHITRTAKNTKAPAPSQRSSFSVLLPYYDNLYRYAVDAEHLYSAGFYRYCLVALRTFTEGMVDSVLTSCGMQELLDEDLYTQINALYYGGKIDKYCFEKLEFLRYSGNIAAHAEDQWKFGYYPNEKPFGASSTLKSIQQAFELAVQLLPRIDALQIKPYALSATTDRKTTPKQITGVNDEIQDDAKLDQRVATKKEFSKEQGKAENHSQIGGFEYKELADGIVITSYTGQSECPIVPQKIAGKYVVEIGDNAFENCSHITQVNLPMTIKKIGDFAFHMCTSLKKVSGSVYTREIGCGAFLNCTELEETCNFSRLECMGNSAFENCSSLKTIRLLDKLKKIPDFAFRGCSKLWDVSITGYSTQLGKESFANCKALSFIYPMNASDIADDAFVGTPYGEKNQNPNQGAFHTDDSMQTNKVDTAEDISLSLVEFFQSKGLEVIDKRPMGGCLWIVGTQQKIGVTIKEACREYEITGAFCGGGRATGYRPAWYTKESVD